MVGVTSHIILRKKFTPGICFFWKENHMLWTIAVVLIILWLVGLVSTYTMGGFIHILLVIAIIVLVVGLIQGRRSG